LTTVINRPVDINHLCGCFFHNPLGISRRIFIRLISFNFYRPSSIFFIKFQGTNIAFTGCSCWAERCFAWHNIVKGNGSFIVSNRPDMEVTMKILKFYTSISVLLMMALPLAGSPGSARAQEPRQFLTGGDRPGVINAASPFNSGGTSAFQGVLSNKLFLPLIGRNLKAGSPPPPSPPPNPLPPPDPPPPLLFEIDGNTNAFGPMYDSGPNRQMRRDLNPGDQQGLQSIPGAATLISPYGTIYTNKPTFKWWPVSNAIWYCLWVKDSFDSGWLWIKASEAGCGSGICSVSVTGSDWDLPDGSATWWICTWNTDGYGPWSAGMNFSIDDLTLEAPTLISPLGATVLSTPTFKWTTVPHALWYKLWVDDSSTRITHSGKVKEWVYTWDAGCVGGKGTCSYTPNTFLADGDAKWWVKACNWVTCGPWSSGMSFSLYGLTPGVATLISPTGTTYSSTPAYKWKAVSLATSYWLLVDDTTGRGKIDKSYTASEAGCASGTCSVIPSTSLADGNATWWIVACNSIGCGPWSNAMGFIVSAGVDVNDIVGLWKFPDNSSVSVERRASGNFEYVGKMVTLTEKQKALGFKVGEEVWWLKKDMPGQFSGEVLWKATDSPPWHAYWKVWINGNNMLDGPAPTGKVIGTRG
jgi:hypothetical protein